jgi:hypothetical protein
VSKTLKDSQEDYERYLAGYSGSELLTKHSLSETGIWQVFGEDPNCDMGGSHVQPDLGLYEGALEDVIREAVNLGRFWQWGGGGRIVKKTTPVVKKVKTQTERMTAEYEELAAMKAELKAALAKVDAKMNQIK